MSTAILARKGDGPWVALPNGLSWELKRRGWEVILARDLMEREAMSKNAAQKLGESTRPKPKA